MLLTLLLVQQCLAQLQRLHVGLNLAEAVIERLQHSQAAICHPSGFVLVGQTLIYTANRFRKRSMLTAQPSCCANPDIKLNLVVCSRPIG